MNVNRRWWWILAPVVVGAGLLMTSCGPDTRAASKDAKGGRGGRGGRGDVPTPVVGARAVRGDIGVYYNGIGSVTPIYTVTIKSRVDGQLMNVNFREGDTVQKGALLMEIDPRPYQVQLEQAEGQQQRDQANLENARVDLARYEGLLKLNAIPEQQVATQRATVKQLEATIKSDQGQIDAAKLNLTYTHITAPITGRLGLRLVDPGNIVHASDQNGLVVITQMQPISVLFTIVEDQLQTVLKRLRAGQRLPVDAFDRDMKVRLARGVLTTVDNEIDPTTGTVRLRSTFENRDNALFPSQFVNARLLVEQRHNVVLLPTAAIQRTSNNVFVFLVQNDAVTIRNITTGVTEGDDTEITSGLAPGDVVVMTGVDKLQEGSKVHVEFPGEGGGRGGSGGRGRGQTGTQPQAQPHTDTTAPVPQGGE